MIPRLSSVTQSLPGNGPNISESQGIISLVGALVGCYPVRFPLLLRTLSFTCLWAHIPRVDSKLQAIEPLCVVRQPIHSIKSTILSTAYEGGFQVWTSMESRHCPLLQPFNHHLCLN